MSDDHTENTEPSQSVAFPLDTDGENTQAGMWTEAPVGLIDASDESVSLRDDALPPELTPPERADRRSASSSTMPIPVAEPSVVEPPPITPAKPPRAAKKRAKVEEPSVNLEQRFPPIRPARGGRLIAFGAIALGTFVSGLVLSSVFSRPGPPATSPILAAPTATLAAVVAPTATPAAVASATPTALAAATPVEIAAVTPTPAPAPAVAATKRAAPPAKKVRAKAVASAPRATKAPSKKSAAPARAAAKASRPSSREEALPWEEADPHRGPNSRVIRTRGGDKSVLVSHNVAITKADGKTVIGKLVDVKGGTVDVLSKGKHVRIAEGDVKDAANY